MQPLIMIRRGVEMLDDTSCCYALTQDLIIWIAVSAVLDTMDGLQVDTIVPMTHQYMPEDRQLAAMKVSRR